MVDHNSGSCARLAPLASMIFKTNSQPRSTSRHHYNMNRFGDIPFHLHERKPQRQQNQPSPQQQTNGNQLFLMQQLQRMEHRNVQLQQSSSVSQNQNPPQDMKLYQQQADSSGASERSNRKRLGATVSLNNGNSRLLPHMKEPGEFDVICAR